MIIQEERHWNLDRAKEDHSYVVVFVVYSLSTACNNYCCIPYNDPDKSPCAKCERFNHETIFFINRLSKMMGYRTRRKK